MSHTIAVCTVKNSGDGQRNCPKHVEFYSKNKCEKLVHLVGFIIRIYHDTRPPERNIWLDDGQRNCPKHVESHSKNKFEKLVHLVGFIIRIQILVCMYHLIPSCMLTASLSLFFLPSFPPPETVCVELNWPNPKRHLRLGGLIDGAVGVFEYIALMVDDSV